MSANGALLELIGDMQGLLDLDEFRLELLHAVRRAVPADWVSLNDIGPDPETYVVISDPVPPAELVELFARYAHQNPLVDYYGRTRNGRAMRFSDLITQQQLHALELYKLVYTRLGVEYQIAFTLPHTKGRILGVALSRRDRDFSDSERDLLEQARPFLIQSYRNSIRHTAVLTDPDQRAVPPLDGLVTLGLTQRQAEVLRLVATGASERDVARSLRISVRTVQKHLERCYRTLGVASRSRAAAIAWSTLDLSVPGSPNEVSTRGYSPSMNPASSAASPGSSSAA
jgi:DNA-binding CsgD family transcriptional regulator